MYIYISCRVVASLFILVIFSNSAFYQFIGDFGLGRIFYRQDLYYSQGWKSIYFVAEFLSRAIQFRWFILTVVNESFEKFGQMEYPCNAGAPNRYSLAVNIFHNFPQSLYFLWIISSSIFGFMIVRYSYPIYKSFYILIG